METKSNTAANQAASGGFYDCSYLVDGAKGSLVNAASIFGDNFEGALADMMAQDFNAATQAQNDSAENLNTLAVAIDAADQAFLEADASSATANGTI